MKRFPSPTILLSAGLALLGVLMYALRANSGLSFNLAWATSYLAVYWIQEAEYLIVSMYLGPFSVLFQWAQGSRERNHELDVAGYIY